MKLPTSSWIAVCGALLAVLPGRLCADWGEYVTVSSTAAKDYVRPLVGKNGEYHYDCPHDQHFLNFAGIKADALKKQLALGKSDSEILDWINANSTTKPQAWQIAQWSAFVEQRGANEEPVL